MFNNTSTDICSLMITISELRGKPNQILPGRPENFLYSSISIWLPGHLMCLAIPINTHCGTSPMMVVHFLQDCQTDENLSAETWPADKPVRDKIYRPVENLQRTSELPVFLYEWTTKKKKTKHTLSPTRFSLLVRGTWRLKLFPAGLRQKCTAPSLGETQGQCCAKPKAL